MVRLAHFSDIHVSTRKLEWRIQDYLNKRFAGWINYRWLGRRHRFRHSKKVLRRLFEELRERKPDHIVFSGDATALGFGSELRVATEIMQIDDPHMPEGLAVPGNHDYSTKIAAGSGIFEKYFARWQQGQRIDNELYPIVQQLGDYWLIGVNSSTANRWAWDATGRVGPDQIERLQRVLAELPAGPRILVTHYPVCSPTGKKEKPFRRLRDLKRLMMVAVEGKISLWLHGHRHKSFHLNDKTIVPFPVVCAGSATQTKLWSYYEYELDGNACQGVRRTFDPKAGCFRDMNEFELNFPVYDS